MKHPVCRRCGRMFKPETGERDGTLVFGTDERGRELCAVCKEELKIEMERKPWDLPADL